jgi:predicted transposase YdaD
VVFKNTGVKQAIHIVEIMNSDDEYRQLAREREETLLNEKLILGAMFEKGIGEGLKQGEQKGLEKGLQQGKREGKREGEQQALLQTARKMLRKNYAFEDISELTGLPVEIIKGLVI